MPPTTANVTFGPRTTAEEVAASSSDSIAGKVVIVTGASLGGLGGETARVVAKYGAGLVVLAGRDVGKLKETECFILKETPSAQLRTLVIDLSSLESVRRAAAEVNAYSEPVDVLINNAAVMAGRYALTTDGFESMFGTNHLGPFLFTNLIRPRLLASASPRVVNVSSAGHGISSVRFDDPGFSGGEKFDKWKDYGQSKTANMLFAVGISQRWRIDAFSLHPGAIMTNLSRALSLQEQVETGFLNPDGTVSNAKFTWKSVEEGASTTVVAAFDPSISSQSGSYLADNQIANDKAQPYALDKANAEKLWVLSERLIAGDASTSA